MNKNAWQRLSRIVYARLDHLGLNQSDLKRLGGPSSAWVRELKATTGPPSARRTKSLRDLSIALGWEPDQARSLLVDDREGWSEALLADEEAELIEDGRAPHEMPDLQPVGMLRKLLDMLRTEDMAGVSEEEWADLLEAVESKMPKQQDKRPQRKTGS